MDRRQATWEYPPAAWFMATRLGEPEKKSYGDGPHTSVAHGDTGVGTTEQIGKVDIMEIYSPPRVIVQAKKFGLRAG